MAQPTRRAQIQRNILELFPGKSIQVLGDLDLTKRVQTCHELHAQVMSSIAMGLNLDQGYFDKYINEQYHNLRL